MSDIYVKGYVPKKKEELLYLLTPKSDWRLISPCNITN